MAVFGYTGADGEDHYTIENYMWGTRFQMGATGGTADSITVKLHVTEVSKNVKCALYDFDKNLVTNGVTEEKEIGVGDAEHTFDFEGTKPDLVADALYYIVAWSQSTTGLSEIYWTAKDYYYLSYDGYTYNGFPPTFDCAALVNKVANIYCTYTESGGSETHTPGDTAKATDSPAFKVKIPFDDTAKATDSPVFKIKTPFEDTAKATDSPVFKIKTPFEDTAKATDEISFKIKHSIEDIAKTKDNIFPDHVSIEDTAHANDSISFSYLVEIETPTENINIYR